MKNSLSSVALRGGSITLLLILLIQVVSFGQNFVPASYPETLYPPIPPMVITNPVSTTTHTSCYSFDRPTGFGQANLLVHAWDDPTGLAGIAWRALDPAMIPYNQGFINYPAGVRDLEVAMYHGPTATSGWNVIAAYYNTSMNMGVTGMGIGGMPLTPGHYYDVFDWTPAGLVYVTTVQLSTMATYTRISIDAHLGYAIAIAWEEPVGIRVAAMEAASGFGPTVTLTGTAGETFPDVAFSHTGTTGTPGIHLVYHKCGRNGNPDGGPGGIGATITESYINWGSVIPPSTLTTIPPVIEDVNFVPWPCDDYRTHLDCPDHNGTDDWTYTYVDPARNRIYARVMDYPTMFGTPVTYCVNDGSIGIPAIDMQYGGTVTNDWPVVSYVQMAPTTPPGFDLYIGWHTKFDNWAGIAPFGPPDGSYVGLKMSTTGTVVSALDYLVVPTNTFPASTTPALNFSKNNEHPFLFTIYAQNDGTNNQFQNKYQPWGNITFKPTAIPEQQAQILFDDMNVYPTPFRDQLKASIPESLMNEDMTISIVNIMGSAVSIFEGKGRDANTFLRNAGTGLANGTYLVNVQAPAAGLKKSFKVQKAE